MLLLLLLLSFAAPPCYSSLLLFFIAFLRLLFPLVLLLLPLLLLLLLSFVLRCFSPLMRCAVAILCCPPSPFLCYSALPSSCAVGDPVLYKTGTKWAHRFSPVLYGCGAAHWTPCRLLSVFSCIGSRRYDLLAPVSVGAAIFVSRDCICFVVCCSTRRPLGLGPQW